MLPSRGMSNHKCHQEQQKYRNILTKWLYVISCVLLWILSWTNLWTLSTDTTTSLQQPQRKNQPQQQDKHNPTLSSSHSATVIGLAIGYNLETFQRFVGSLRRTGYEGHILLGIDESITSHDTEITNYIMQQNVTIYTLHPTNCTADYYQTSPVIQCVAPYPDLKVRWSKYALAADWLQACATCTGPVLITDVRDVLFQSNPFAGAYNNNNNNNNMASSLQLFAEHPVQSTMHKLVKKPILKCRHVVYKHKPMLCSGTTAGPRKEMLQYLQIMKAELQAWATEPPHCPLSHKAGGDQAVHNYLYYAGKLNSTIPTVVVPFGQGMVTTAAAWAQVLQWEYDENNKNNNASTLAVLGLDFLVAHNVTDRQGYFVQSDGVTQSAVVHQFDRFRWAGYDPNWVHNI